MEEKINVLLLVVVTIFLLVGCGEGEVITDYAQGEGLLKQYMEENGLLNGMRNNCFELVSTSHKPVELPIKKSLILL